MLFLYLSTYIRFLKVQIFENGPQTRKNFVFCTETASCVLARGGEYVIKMSGETSELHSGEHVTWEPLEYQRPDFSAL